MVILSSKLRHKMTDKQDNAGSPKNTDNDISNSVKLKKCPVVIRAYETSRAMDMQCVDRAQTNVQIKDLPQCHIQGTDLLHLPELSMGPLLQRGSD